MQASEGTTRLDEAAYYWATGAALGAAVLATGAGAGSVRVGLVGAALACAGIFVSWRIRRWGWTRALVVGSAGAVAAAVSLQALIGWEVETEATSIYRALGDVGLTMGLQMAVLAVGLSFLLVRREVLPFSLVPALSLFGLVGGRGRPTVVAACFVPFLAAALVATGQAMLLSGMPEEGRPGPVQWRLSNWRKRHWMTLGAFIAAIMVVAYLLFIPLVTYATQYRWPLPLAFVSERMGGTGRLRTLPDSTTSYGVGRGPVALTQTPLMRVKGIPAELWRGEVFDVYTGRAWLKAESEPSRVRITGDVVDLTEAVPSDPNVRVVHHTVRTEASLPLVFYGPGQVRRVALGEGVPRELSDGLRVDKYGCIAAPGMALPRGASYEVVSEPLTMGRGWRGSSSRAAGAMLGEADEAYLRIPLSSRRVADLAREVAGSADTPLQKLTALVRHLQENYAYTLNAPAVPQGEDVADYFLFRQKRGQCDVFATALAVMARAVGIPTRFVVGYAGGEYDPERGDRVIREADAHAWVEAYLPVSGWVSADATAADELPPIPALQRALLGTRFLLEDHPIAGTMLAAGVLAVLLVAFHLARRGGGRSLRARAKADPRAAVVWTYAQLCQLLRRQGRPRGSSQTPLEFLRALESALATAPSGRGSRLSVRSLPPVRALTELFVQARYGPGPVTEQTARVALRRLAEVRETLRRRGARQPA